MIFGNFTYAIINFIESQLHKIGVFGLEKTTVYWGF